MAELVLGPVHTIFAALQSSKLKDVCSVWGYGSQLEELNQTVINIKDLLDAETEVLSNEQRGYIKDIIDIVYEANDFFDEFLTRLEVKQLQRSRIKKGGKFYKKVVLFFSFNEYNSSQACRKFYKVLVCCSSNEDNFSQASKLFYKVKEILTKLNSIMDNHRSAFDFPPIRQRETQSSVHFDPNNIIGRDDDKKVVIKMLLESKNQDVGFMTVVGLPGVGKTALAELVYNDDDVKREFGDLRFWVHVSNYFDVETILSQILMSVTKGQRSFDAFGFSQLQEELQQELRGKKYMLVLDDVWNEDRAKWDVLQECLMFGKRGSKVLVTSPSEMTAEIVGDGDHTYRLQGLLPEKSWDLFKMVAFNQGNYQQNEFLVVGEKIVAKCCNFPLAIRVVGRLLYGQDIKKWILFEEIGLSKIKEDDNIIMSILKLSYYNLESSLKSCFTYCAIFPKDYEIEKERLINLWMAQGYTMSADAAEKYFSILLRRCFFIDVFKDIDGNIMSVKMHDLMHNVAQEIAGKEIQIGGYNVGDEVRHLSFDGKNGPPISSITTKLHSYICLSLQQVYQSSQLVPNQLKYLRALELQHLDDIKSFKSIGEFLHLRYLGLSYSTFEAFPENSITKLHNLQTFILCECNRLRELPHDFSKLEKLIRITIIYCNELQTMPSLSKLPYLKSLVLEGLDKLEYMEKTSSSTRAEETPFFPSLENLRIVDADKLKGLFGEDPFQSIGRFTYLSRLEIRNCPELKTFPPCQAVQTICCQNLRIVKQVVGNGNHTSLLATLNIVFAPTKELEDDIIPWEALNESLRTLVFHIFTHKSLPEGMKHLTSLRTLKIRLCHELNALPEWISCLTCLQDFQIIKCSQVLYERCREPYGEDWPKIQHIPNKNICK